MSASTILLDVNGIEVIYDHVILVLKGVSLKVPEGSIVALLGGNGAVAKFLGACFHTFVVTTIRGRFRVAIASSRVKVCRSCSCIAV